MINFHESRLSLLGFQFVAAGAAGAATDFLGLGFIKGMYTLL